MFNEIDEIRIEKSKNTDKIRYIYFSDNLLLTLKPTNGLFTLSLFSAKKIINKTSPPRLRCVVLTEISEFIKKGRNVFCKHVVDIDYNLRALDEVIVVNQNDNLLAVGRLKIPVPYILNFKSGVATIVRRGVSKSKIKNSNKLY